MHGKYLANRVCKKWKEDFVDEETGEVVSVDRTELLVERGGLVEGDLFAKLQFYLQAGDISYVEVSNQRREAVMAMYDACMNPYSVSARIERKTKKFLLYASSAQTALEIAKDYIELNFKGCFHFIGVKAFDYCVFLPNNIRKMSKEEAEPEEDTDEEGKQKEQDFYKIEVEVLTNDSAFNQTFVLQGKDIDTCMIRINDWILKQMKEKEKDDEVTTTVKSGVVIPCCRIIEKEFSEAYAKADDYLED